MSNSTMARKSGRRLFRVLFMCVICIAINFGVSYIAALAGIPLYLDSIGIVLASVLCGPIPGVIIGLVTSFIKGLFDHSSIFYGAISVLIALIAAWMATKGYLKKFGGIIVTVLALALVGGGFGSLLTWFLFGFATEGASVDLAGKIYDILPINKFFSQLTADFIIDIADKAITVGAVLFILRLIPVRIKEKFRYEGWMQNPPTKAQLVEIKADKVRKISLRTKIVILIATACIGIAIAAVSIGYILFRTSTIEDHKLLGEGVAGLAASAVDGDSVNDYLNGRGDQAEYRETLDHLYDIRNSAPDVEYVYVYQIREDGCHVVFDLDTDDLPGAELGEVIPFDDSFSSYIDDLLAGETIEPIITDDSYGWLLTVYNPVYDSDGNTVCYACVDISMNQLRSFGYSFLARQVSLFLGFFVLIIAVGLFIAEYHLIFPVNSMAMMASAMAFDEEKKKSNSDDIHSLDIHTGDEIENLYRALCKTTDDINNYVEDLQNKQETISRMQSGLIMVLADMVESRDKSTGDHVRKTAAYVNLILEELRREGKFSDIITDEYIDRVTSAAPLHDIGKIKVSDVVLNKPARLTDDEYEMMKRHTVEGREILKMAIENVAYTGYLGEAVKIAESHHERWDGKGYPNGLKGDEIPLSARVMAVADVFDALVSRRCYKEPFSLEEAMDIIREGKEKQFDPDVAEAFISISEKVRKVAESFSGGYIK